MTTAATAAKLATVARSIITCKSCGTRHLFVGTGYTRNGMFCTCETTGTPGLAYWFACVWAPGVKVMPTMKAASVKATRTETKCGDECKSARCDRCACECAGENHGQYLGLAV